MPLSLTEVARISAQSWINKEIHERLVERAKSMDCPSFVQSLTPNEYREVSAFWGCSPIFWEEHSGKSR